MQDPMISCEFKEEKRPAQLSAHYKPYFRAQVIIDLQIAMVERTADCNKVLEDVVRLIYFENVAYIGKIEKAYNARNIITIDEIPAVLSNLEPGAQPKLVHAYYKIDKIDLC